MKFVFKINNTLIYKNLIICLHKNHGIYMDSNKISGIIYANLCMPPELLQKVTKEVKCIRLWNIFFLGGAVPLFICDLFGDIER